MGEWADWCEMRKAADKKKAPVKGPSSLDSGGKFTVYDSEVRAIQKRLK